MHLQYHKVTSDETYCWHLVNSGSEKVAVSQNVSAIPTLWCFCLLIYRYRRSTNCKRNWYPFFTQHYCYVIYLLVLWHLRGMIWWNSRSLNTILIVWVIELVALTLSPRFPHRTHGIQLSGDVQTQPLNLHAHPGYRMSRGNRTSWQTWCLMQWKPERRKIIWWTKCCEKYSLSSLWK